MSCSEPEHRSPAVGLPGLGHDPGDRGAPGGLCGCRGCPGSQGGHGPCLALPQRCCVAVSHEPVAVGPPQHLRAWIGERWPRPGESCGPSPLDSITLSFLGCCGAGGIACPATPVPRAEGPHTGPSCIKFCDLCSWLRVHDCSEGSSQGGVHPTEGHHRRGVWPGWTLSLLLPSPGDGFCL